MTDVRRWIIIIGFPVIGLIAIGVVCYFDNKVGQSSHVDDIRVKEKALRLVEDGIRGHDLSQKTGTDEMSMSDLWFVIRESDANQVRRLFGEMPDANKQKLYEVANTETNNNGQTILAVVIAQDDFEKYETMKQVGINALKDNNVTNHIFYALECGSTNIVYRLVEEVGSDDVKKRDILNRKDQSNCNWTPLMYAARRGDLQLCKYLIDNGADVDAKDRMKQDVLIDPGTVRKPDIYNYIKAMRDLKKCQSRYFGSPNYDVKKIHRFLENGVDVDYRWNFKSHNQYWHIADYGWTFLRWAVVNNEANLVRELVKKGSKINEGYHRHDGMLPLEYAVDKYVKGKEGKEDWSVVDELLKADDARISAFKEVFNVLIAAERALTTIKDRGKLDKLQVEKAIADCRKEFLAKAKDDKLKEVKKLLPKTEALRKDWLGTALKQKETGKKVREYLERLRNVDTKQ